MVKPHPMKGVGYEMVQSGSRSSGGRCWGRKDNRTGLMQDAETKWARSDKMKAAGEGTHVPRGKRIGLQSKQITLAGKLREKK